jgi:hypothetical protein
MCAWRACGCGCECVLKGAHVGMARERACAGVSCVCERGLCGCECELMCA